MSTCSAAEIAEKKRIALEKLKARKALISANATATCQQAATGSKPHTVTPAKLTSSSFYSSTNGAVQNKTNAVPNIGNNNKASAFLNALKQSTVFSHRQEARDAAHPYKRSATSALNSGAPSNSTAQAGNSAEKQLAPVFGNNVSCKVSMISTKRFMVETSKYHVKLIEIFKSVPSKSYDPQSRNWNFDLKDYQTIQQKVAELKPEVVIGQIPKFVLNLCSQAQPQKDLSFLISIEPKLSQKLMPFQQEGVCFAIAHGGRIMICDEMGLGKTYQALAVADFYRDDWPMLICTTASTRESWANHVRTLLPSVPLQYIQVMASNQKYIGDSKVVITSYTMMEKQLAAFKDRKFGCIIFDESHALKNFKAKCTAVADILAQQAKRIILLSGTPALSRPEELFTQLKIIDRKFLSYKEYTARYCDGKQTNFGWQAAGQSNLQELKILLSLKYMIRRTKADVLPELAAKNRETVVLDATQMIIDDSSKEAMAECAKNFLASKGREREEILLKYYARTAEVKTAAVCAYLKTVVKEGKKFIIFAHHRVMMDAISSCLRKLKVDYIRIDGTTKNEARAEYIQTFQNQKTCQVAVLSLRACNSGITLTSAELIIFAELDWNPSTLAQAESRAHRIGQQNTVTCRYLMATKTADDLIWNMLKSKQEVLNKAGLFCENLQEATHTAAIDISNQNKITKYCSTENTEQEAKVSEEAVKVSANCDISKELENIEDFFGDDDDEAFSNIKF